MKAERATEREVAEWIRERRVFLAEVDRDVVVGVRVERTDPDRLKVSRLGVREDWQGAGVGAELLERAEEAAREAGGVTKGV